MNVQQSIVTTGQTTALWTNDAQSIARMIADGESTAVEVVSAHLRRIADTDPAIRALAAAARIEDTFRPGTPIDPRA